MKLIKDEKVIGELKRIEAENGILQAEKVVEAARPKKSILHNYFTWDNNEAAERWRIYQARNLIRIVVQVIPGSDEKKTVNVFASLTSDRTEEGGGYRSIVNILSDAGMKRQLLQDALEDMKRFEERYESLKELAEIFAAFKKVRDGLK